MKAQLLEYGERGILVRELVESERLAILRSLQSSSPPGLEEAVYGYDSVLLLFKAPTPRPAIQQWLDAVPSDAAAAARKGRLHRVPVIYDGPDLESLAERVSLSVEELIERHSAPTYGVRMMGFTPGFPYLEGLDPLLQIPRRASPRARIAPGSVAIGGPHAGIYSVASPGGWHLLGRTEFVLFHPGAARAGEPNAAEVFPCATGDQVQFVPVTP